MINNKLSQEIYSQLINGKVINKHSYHIKTNELQENLLYTELFNNLKDYEELYQRINFYLIHKGGSFFFIRELNPNSEEANEPTIKIQALLIIIGRIFTERGYLFDTLTHYRSGIKPEILIEAVSEERYLDILQACNLCNKSTDIEKEIKNHLIDRELMFKNSQGYYVLTDAGTAFFNELAE